MKFQPAVPALCATMAACQLTPSDVSDAAAALPAEHLSDELSSLDFRLG